MFKSGDSIYKFGLKIDYLKDTTSFTVQEYKVLDSNEKMFVLKDSDFTRLQYKKPSFLNTVFKTVDINHSNFMPYWDYLNGTYYTQFPSKKIALNKLKKEMTKWIYEKHGRYCKGIDLLESIKE